MVRILCWFSAKIPPNIWKFAQGVKYRFAGPSAQWGALGGCKFGRFHQWGQGQFARVGEKNKDASTRCRRKVREEQNADCWLPPTLCPRSVAAALWLAKLATPWWALTAEHPGEHSVQSTLGPTLQNCVRRWKISAQSLQKVSGVEQVSWSVLRTWLDQSYSLAGCWLRRERGRCAAPGRASSAASVELSSGRSRSWSSTSSQSTAPRDLRVPRRDPTKPAFFLLKIKTRGMFKMLWPHSCTN